MTYNQEDCAALRRVTEFVHADGPEPARGRDEARRGGAARRRAVEELDDWRAPKRWGEIEFVHADFEFVNGCAYFDYQRERVYVRTSKAIRKRQRRKHAGAPEPEAPGQPAGPDRRPEVPLLRGHGRRPVCRRRKRAAGYHPRLKRAFDLVFTPGGIRRQVIECRAVGPRVPDLRQGVRPGPLRAAGQALPRAEELGHVPARRPPGSASGRSRTMIEEFFGLRVFDAEVHMFKSLMARLLPAVPTSGSLEQDPGRAGSSTSTRRR